VNTPKRLFVFVIIFQAPLPQKRGRGRKSLPPGPHYGPPGSPITGGRTIEFGPLSIGVLLRGPSSERLSENRKQVRRGSAHR
jgi:hypothetical protein